MHAAPVLRLQAAAAQRFGDPDANPVLAFISHFSYQVRFFFLLHLLTATAGAVNALCLPVAVPSSPAVACTGPHARAPHGLVFPSSCAPDAPLPSRPGLCRVLALHPARRPAPHLRACASQQVVSPRALLAPWLRRLRAAGRGGGVPDQLGALQG